MLLTIARACGFNDGFLKNIALPGAVTSMTAQGYLPHYGGHAAASLTPTIANAAASMVSSGKMVEAEDASHTGPDKGSENRPPTVADSADGQVLNQLAGQMVAMGVSNNPAQEQLVTN